MIDGTPGVALVIFVKRDDFKSAGIDNVQGLTVGVAQIKNTPITADRNARQVGVMALQTRVIESIKT